MWPPPNPERAGERASDGRPIARPIDPAPASRALSTFASLTNYIIIIDFYCDCDQSEQSRTEGGAVFPDSDSSRAWAAIQRRRACIVITRLLIIEMSGGVYIDVEIKKTVSRRDAQHFRYETARIAISDRCTANLRSVFNRV